MAYMTVDVNVELDEFDDQELIDELEDRGWYVGEEKGWVPVEQLTDDELNHIAGFYCHCKPGTIEHSIYEKLRKR